MKNIKEMLELLQKSGYIKANFSNNRINGIELTFLGSSLLQNIQNEWSKNRSDVNIYPVKWNIGFSSNTKSILTNYVKTEYFKENFVFIKNKFQKHLPLAIKTLLVIDNLTEENKYTDCHFDIPKKNFLLCDYLFSETQAYEKFSKIQRERKIWWMKLCVDPGRFYLSELKTEIIKKQKIQSVKIKAKFNFGDIILEKIQIMPLKSLDLENIKDFYLFDNKVNRKMVPILIHTEVCAEIATTAVLFDAVENSKKEIICLQRNIAPYQCSIFCILEDEKIHTNEDLKDLAKHLKNVLRKLNITTLNLDKNYLTDLKTLTKEFEQIDKIGVPYSIIIDSNSLQNGLMKLRNRDTTLFEDIHISDVPNYLVKIFNS